MLTVNYCCRCPWILQTCGLEGEKGIKLEVDGKSEASQKMLLPCCALTTEKTSENNAIMAHRIGNRGSVVDFLRMNMYLKKTAFC